MSITSRFMLLVATAAVAPLVAYGGVSITSLLSGTRQSVTNGNLGVAARAAEQMQQYVSMNTRILRALAADLQRTSLEPWQQERILRNYVIAFREFREITLFDAAGVPRVSSRLGAPRVRVPDGARAAPYELFLTPFTLDDDLLPAMTAAVRLAQLDRHAGWLVAEFDLVEMWRMVDRIRIGDLGFALIVAEDGRLVAHGDPNQRRRVARGDNLRDHPLVRRVREEGVAPVAAEFDGEDGRRVLGAAAAVPALGWTLIVEEPTEEAYAAARQLVRQLFIVISLAVVATITGGFLWGRSFIRPIFALIRGTRALSEGRLHERVRIDSGGDEFEQLGTAFNRMSDRLVEAQDNVRKQERQAVFGRIAQGLVHDLAHPIQNVANSCKLILKMPGDAEYREMFRSTTEREFATVRRVLEGLRNLARPLPLERFPVDVNRSVAELVEAMQSHGELAGVTIRAELCPEAPAIEGDLFALGRVYRNLITNALQATAPGGLITVTTATRDGRVTIAVADTGCGIPPDRQREIFEDFATTKRRGLGLGLAICQRIVEQLGGTISVSSEVGRGTTFVLEFRAADVRPMPAAS